MIIDARSVEENSLIEADICILGAGAAGITLARELGSRHRKVCVLESGGLNLDIATQALYQGQVEGWPYWPLDTCRLRFFGGTTNHWGGSCLPLDEDDFVAKPWISTGGWPISKSDLLPFYRRAQPVFGMGEYFYDAPALLQGAGEQLWNGDGITAGMIRRSAVSSFGVEYREELDQATGIEVYLNGNAVNVKANEGRTHVEAVDVVCLSGNRFRMRARTFVLAMGGIENARLLLESRAAGEVGLGNEHDLVGRYFSDHAYLANLGVLQIVGADADLGKFSEVIPLDGTTAKFFLHVTPETRAREQLLNTRLHVQSVPWIEFGRDRGKPPRDLSDRVVGRLESLLGDLRGEKAPARKGTTAEDYGAPAGSRLFRVGAWTDVVPRPESRVYLGEAKDALGLRKPVLNWQIGQEEKQSLVKSLELLARRVGRVGIGRMRIDLDDDSPWPWTGGYEPGLHQMGTTRMSNSPQQGVVDRNCKVHGLSNLFVAGSSVFPTYGTANPTLTIVALAIRLADHIKQSTQQL